MAKKTDPITPELLNDLAPPDQEDEVIGSTSSEFVTATTATAGPGIHEVIAAAGSGTSIFNQDSALTERFSRGNVEAQNIAYTDSKNAEMKGIAECAAALQASGVQQYASNEYKERLKNITAKAANMPTPDVITEIDSQRIVITGPQQKVGTRFDTLKTREEALDLLSAMIGHDKTIEVISCARTAGITFVNLPIHWLSQMLAVESKKNAVFDDLPRDAAFAEDIDGQLTQDFPASMAKLFSQDTARQVQIIAKMHRVSMLYVLRYLIDKVCKERRRLVGPGQGATSKYIDIIPTVANLAA